MPRCEYLSLLPDQGSFVCRTCNWDDNGILDPNSRTYLRGEISESLKIHHTTSSRANGTHAWFDFFGQRTRALIMASSMFVSLREIDIKNSNNEVELEDSSSFI